MSLSLAYLGTLAFVAFVLWLRSRRAETVGERILAISRNVSDLSGAFVAMQHNAFDSVAREGLEGVAGTLVEQKGRIDELSDRVESLLLKSGLERKRAA